MYFHTEYNSIFLEFLWRIAASSLEDGPFQNNESFILHLFFGAKNSTKIPPIGKCDIKLGDYLE